MRPRPPLPGGPYLVVGLARSGTAAALALHAHGEEVVGVDSGSSPEAGRIAAAGVEVHLDVTGEDLVGDARTLIKSPGVPAQAPVVAAARARGVEVMGELELAWRLLPGDFIAVTGTNGKTTTTELIGHVHREAGIPVAVAGNIGTALSSLVGEAGPETTVVCEASSFQLEDSIAFAPEAAVLLNITPDHEDRHASFADYVGAKLQVFARQTPGEVAVVPLDLDLGSDHDDIGGEARRVRFGPSAAADLEDRDGTLLWQGEPLMDAAEIRLPGPHNRQNAMAAAAACLARGVPAPAVRHGLASFAGVPHRLERVGERAGVAYVNDSKATNVASTLVALASFEDPIHLILGGRGKQQSFTPLRERVAERCAAVYLIGEASDELAEALAGVPVAIRRCGDLERAVAAARGAAVPGEVVLLSPACASYDQYADFEERGAHFRRLVSDP
jgi:UDP-N-acetylmuramoylalanine--D-glutamate ligase